MADEADALDDLPAPKPSKLPLIIGVVNLLATILVVVKVMTFSAGPTTIIHQAPEPAPESVPGPVHAFEPFIVNLNEPQGGRFLKAVLEFEVKNDKVVSDLTQAERRIRDEILRYLSSLRVADTLGEEAKVKIQEELAARLNKHVGEGKVTKTYFAQFVVQ